MTSDRIQKIIANMPDEAEFSDENGNRLEEYDVLELTPELKYAIATLSIKWHQSIEKTIVRMIMSGAKATIKKELNND